jgi:hypothetical protein
VARCFSAICSVVRCEVPLAGLGLGLLPGCAVLDSPVIFLRAAASLSSSSSVVPTRRIASSGAKPCLVAIFALSAS